MLISTYTSMLTVHHINYVCKNDSLGYHLHFNGSFPLSTYRWPSCHLTNSVKALKRSKSTDHNQRNWPSGLTISSFTTKLLRVGALLSLKRALQNQYPNSIVMVPEFSLSVSFKKKKRWWQFRFLLLLHVYVCYQERCAAYGWLWQWQRWPPIGPTHRRQ